MIPPEKQSKLFGGWDISRGDYESTEETVPLKTGWLLKGLVAGAGILLCFATGYLFLL